MADDVLKLATIARCYVSSIRPGAPYDDEEVYETYFRGVEPELLEAFGSLTPEQWQAFSANAVAFLATLEDDGLNAAITTGIAATEHLPRQQSDIVLLAGAASLLVGVTGAVTFMIILASRLGSWKGSGFEVKFYQGVPKETAEIVKTVAAQATAFDRIIDKIKADE